MTRLVFLSNSFFVKKDYGSSSGKGLARCFLFSTGSSSHGCNNLPVRIMISGAFVPIPQDGSSSAGSGIASRTKTAESGNSSQRRGGRMIGCASKPSSSPFILSPGIANVSGSGSISSAFGGKAAISYGRNGGIAITQTSSTQKHSSYGKVVWGTINSTAYYLFQTFFRFIFAPSHKLCYGV